MLLGGAPARPPAPTDTRGRLASTNAIPAAHTGNKSILDSPHPPTASKPQQTVKFQHSFSKRVLYHRRPSVDFTGQQTRINTQPTHTHAARDQKEFRVSKQTPPQKRVSQCSGSGVMSLIFFSSASYNTALSFLLQGNPSEGTRTP